MTFRPALGAPFDEEKMVKREISRAASTGRLDALQQIKNRLISHPSEGGYDFIDWGENYALVKVLLKEIRSAPRLSRQGAKKLLNELTNELLHKQTPATYHGFNDLYYELALTHKRIGQRRSAIRVLSLGIKAKTSSTVPPHLANGSTLKLLAKEMKLLRTTAAGHARPRILSKKTLAHIDTQVQKAAVRQTWRVGEAEDLLMGVPIQLMVPHGIAKPEATRAAIKASAQPHTLDEAHFDLFMDRWRSIESNGKAIRSLVHETTKARRMLKVSSRGRPRSTGAHRSW